MEVYYNGTWGTICHTNWSIDDASVVCRQLGYARAFAAPDYGAFGAGSGPVRLSVITQNTNRFLCIPFIVYNEIL